MKLLMIKNICLIGLNNGCFLFHPFGVVGKIAVGYKNVNPSGFLLDIAKLYLAIRMLTFFGFYWDIIKLYLNVMRKFRKGEIIIRI